MTTMVEKSIFEKLKSKVFVEGRKPWIDFLRAIAIALVVFGHHLPTTMENRYLYFLFTSPIKLPLFFAISGYLFSADKKNLGQFILKIFRQLIMPWIVLGLIGALMQYAFNGSSIIGSLQSLITGKSFWYMPCLIIAEIVFFLITKYIKKIWIVIVTCIVCFAGGYFLFKIESLNILMINRALCVQLFLLLGFLIKKHEDKIFSLGWGIILGLIIVYIGAGVISIAFYHGCDMDVHMCDYYCLPINIIMVLSGVTTLFVVSSKASHYPKWISFIGQNTLLTYMMNAYPVSAFVKVLAVIGIVIPEGVLSAAVYLVTALIGCSVISMIVNYFVPEIVGRKR